MSCAQLFDLASHLRRLAALSSALHRAEVMRLAAGHLALASRTPDPHIRARAVRTAHAILTRCL